MAPPRAADSKACLRVVTDLSRDLRFAILARDHGRAGQLASAYVDSLRTLWESMPEDQRSVSTLPSEARTLLVWAHQSTLIHKAIAADQLSVVQKTGNYHPPSTAQIIQVKA